MASLEGCSLNMLKKTGLGRWNGFQWPDPFRKEIHSGIIHRLSWACSAVHDNNKALNFCKHILFYGTGGVAEIEKRISDRRTNFPSIPCTLLALTTKAWNTVTASESMEQWEWKCCIGPYAVGNGMGGDILEVFPSTESIVQPPENPDLGQWSAVSAQWPLIILRHRCQLFSHIFWWSHAAHSVQHAALFLVSASSWMQWSIDCTVAKGGDTTTPVSKVETSCVLSGISSKAAICHAKKVKSFVLFSSTRRNDCQLCW